jgi:hypothetical protein
MDLSANPRQKLGYTIELIGYDQWPSLSVKYTFKNVGAVPHLRLNFKFDSVNYLLANHEACDIDVLNERATADLVIFKNILDQLSWRYTTDETPGEAKRVIKHSVTLSLAPATQIDFTESDLLQLKSFVKQIISWLTQVTDAKSKEAIWVPVMRPFLLPITGALESKNVFELGVALNVTQINSDTGLPVGQISKAIQPDIIAGISLNTGQKAFANNFEKIFKTTGSQLKLATGTGDYENAAQLWTVRLADTVQDNGIWYSIAADKATFFAPAPLSTKPVNGNAVIQPYISGLGIEWNAAGTESMFKDIELDGWLSVCLEAIDYVLDPALRDAILTCVTLYTLQQSDAVNPLEQLLSSKAAIAVQLAKRITPILKELTGNLGNAEQHLIKQLNYKLGELYSGTAIVQFNASISANSGTDLCNLYGNIIPLSNTIKAASFSDGVMSNTTASTISFTVNAYDAKLQRYMPVNVNFRLYGLDYKFDEGIIIPLSFIVPPTAMQLLSANVPMVLRAQPRLATVFEQLIKRSYTAEAVTTLNLKLYDYIYRYNKAAIAQDIVETTLHINADDVQVHPSNSGTNSLFNTLAQFAGVYPQLTADLKASLLKIDTKTTVDSDAYKLALPALKTLSEFGVKVISALGSIDTIKLPANSAQSPHAAYIFTIKESPVSMLADKRLLIQVSAAKGQAQPLDLPLVLIDGYNAVLFETIDSAASISKSFLYVSATNEPLCFVENNLDSLSRTIKFSSLDVLSIESINLSLNENRNNNLLPKADGAFFTTDESFIYKINQDLPALVPGVFWEGVEINLQDVNTTSAKTNLKVCLQQLFDNLFNSLNNVIYQASIKVNYEYRADGMDFLPWISLPVLVANDMPINTSTKSEQATALSDAIEQYMDNVRLDEANARLTFQLDVFTSLKPSGIPLLSVNKLYFNLNDVK